MKNKNGFTFVELIVSTVVLSIAVAGVYAAFLSTARFSGVFRHEILAAIGTQGWLEQARAEHRFDNNDLPATGTPQTIADLSKWQRLGSEVNDLAATSKVDTNINLGSNNAAYNFKRITVTVKWNERQI
jgi:prepilin-type N-terminal cleavage/methylation domain-containing protein